MAQGMLLGAALLMAAGCALASKHEHDEKKERERSMAMEMKSEEDKERLRGFLKQEIRSYLASKGRDDGLTES